MTVYAPPLKEIQFALRALADLDLICQQSGFQDASPELVSSVLEEAGKLAAGAIAPLSSAGDRNPPRIVDGEVVQTDGFAELYQQFVAGGWTTVSASVEHGGMGLPQAVGFATMELWSAANLSFALCPMLGQGAIEAMESHASDALKSTFLGQIISGNWTGTMNLTEPQAGSDLAVIKTKAQPHDDHYRITGGKIFITWGDHAMADNIVHLVLARIEGAPPGVAGVSLFLVPKYLVNVDGAIGEHNDVYPISLESKMGIHGSPTCSMNYGDAGQGAVGFLVGEENKGLSYMFTMMNHARLNVGIQGVGLSDRAYQLAVKYAGERVQGKPPQALDGAIIHHPDVRRMLMLMRSLSEAARAICYATAGYMDLQGADDPELAVASRSRCDLLIPIAKTWSTEAAQEVTSLGVQVHGGMGYIEETGAAQLLRDARITTIYEGTTGIQANDLLGRKVLRDRGKALRELLQEMRDTQQRVAAIQGLALASSTLLQAIEWLETGLETVLVNAEDAEKTAASAVNFLMACGTCVGGWLLCKSAVVANERLLEDADFYQAKITTCNFFAAHVMPRTQAYVRAVQFGAGAELMLTDSQFGL